MKEKAKVDPEQLKQKASELEKYLHDCRQLLDEMERKMNATSQYWEGSASSVYRDVFSLQKKECISAIEELTKYPKSVAMMADYYHIIVQNVSDKIKSINEFSME